MEAITQPSIEFVPGSAMAQALLNRQMFGEVDGTAGVRRHARLFDSIPKSDSIPKPDPWDMKAMPDQAPFPENPLANMASGLGAPMMVFMGPLMIFGFFSRLWGRKLESKPPQESETSQSSKDRIAENQDRDKPPFTSLQKAPEPPGIVARGIEILWKIEEAIENFLDSCMAYIGGITPTVAEQAKQERIRLGKAPNLQRKLSVAHKLVVHLCRVPFEDPEFHFGFKALISFFRNDQPPIKDMHDMLAPIASRVLTDRMALVNLASDRNLEEDFLSILRGKPPRTVEEIYTLSDLCELFISIVSHQNYEYPERLRASAQRIIYSSPLNNPRDNRVDNDDP